MRPRVICFVAATHISVWATVYTSLFIIILFLDPHPCQIKIAEGSMRKADARKMPTLILPVGDAFS